jgi:hypothetical protein
MMLRLFAVGLVACSLLTTAGCHSCTSTRSSYAAVAAPCPTPCPNGTALPPPPPLPPRF